MNKESIFFKINLLFGGALVAVIIAYFLMLDYEIKKQKKERIKNLNFILQELKHSNQISQDLLDVIDAKIVPQILYKDILKSAKRSFKRFKYGIAIVSIKKENKEFFFIRKGKSKFIIYFNKNHNPQIYTTIFFIIFTTFLIIIYIILRKNLKPLLILESEIINHSLGKDINIKKIDEKNEVARINNAFLEYAKKTKDLRNARRLFIRNIFHELNTPVTKGKLLAEVTDDKKTKNMLNSIFNRLSNLLSDLAQMEQIVSKEYNLKISKIPIIELIDQAKDLLYINDIKHNITNEVIEGDFKLLSIVFKNLIDNAKKYGQDLEILIDNRVICFISKGKKLKNDLSYYTRPFTKNGQKSGFGLGLYITNEILNMHKMRFFYKFKDEKNYFCIEF